MEKTAAKQKYAVASQAALFMRLSRLNELLKTARLCPYKCRDDFLIVKIKWLST